MAAVTLAIAMEKVECTYPPLYYCFLFAHSAIVNYDVDFDILGPGPITVPESTGAVTICVDAVFAPDLDISPLLADGRIQRVGTFTSLNISSSPPFSNFGSITGFATFSGAGGSPADAST